MTKAAGEPSTRNDPNGVSAARIASGWRLSLAELGVLAGWSLAFYLLNKTPLGAADLWGHVANGRWLLEQHSLPAADPLVPFLAMPWIDTAWLTQVLLGEATAWGGGEALSLLFAVTVLVTYLTLARTFYLQTGNRLVAHLGVLVVAALGWSRTATARPEMFGALCFAILLWLLVRERVADATSRSPGGSPGSSSRSPSGGSPGSSDATATQPAASGRGVRWSLWLGIPLLLLLWANLHSSFGWGLLVLACWIVGIIAETAWRERSLGGVLAEPAVRRWIWVGELALLATCLNPYGPRLLLYQFWFANYEPLRELADWRRLVLWEAGGRELAASLAVLMVILRFSRRRIPVADMLLIAAFSLALGSGPHMAWWYAAVFAVVVTPHLGDLLHHLGSLVTKRRTDAPQVSWETRLGLPEGGSGSYSLVALGLVWITLAVAPAGTWLLHQTPRAPAQLFSAATPWQVSAFLRENPPTGQVFNPDWWGDWLTWDGPPGLRVFMTSQMHLAPRSVWVDYRIVRENRAGWDHVLDRYVVQTVILDKQRQKTLIGYLRGSTGWHVLHEDEGGIVFGRTPTGPAVGKPSPAVGKPS